eukprot:2384958-Rhodomonas_salina.3
MPLHPQPTRSTTSSRGGKQASQGNECAPRVMRGSCRFAHRSSSSSSSPSSSPSPAPRSPPPPLAARLRRSIIASHASSANSTARTQSAPEVLLP